MKKRVLLLMALLSIFTQSTQAQQTASPLQPVSADDVKVTAVNNAYFTDEGIVVVSPDEDPGPALARRRASEFTSEGTASLTGAKLYSYTYPSVDAEGNEVTLSALMAVPTRMILENSFAKPNNLIIGCHVTITSNYECPTEYNRSGGVASWKTDVGMLIDYTRYDFVRQPCCLVILPDYEGYGLSKDRAHPYLYQELTARQVVDAVRSGLAMYNDNKGGLGFGFQDFENGWKSVSVGYSQGGSVSLATHRFIEENGLADELHFAGSVCGDGPYDPVAHLAYYINDNGESYEGNNRTQHKRATVSMPIVMPLILKGMCDRNPFMRQHKVDEYLSEKFMRTGVIDFLNAKSQESRDMQYPTSKVNDAFRTMREKGLSYTYYDEESQQTLKGEYTPAEMQQMFFRDDGDNVHGRLEQIMSPSAFHYFSSFTKDSPVPEGRGLMEDLHRAVASNVMVSGWRPKHRIAFYHSTYDTVVPYENLLSFINTHDDLNYFIHDNSRNAPKPSHIVSKDDADIYIYDTHSKEDHVGAGVDFYFMGVPSPDYMLMKWVIEKHTFSTPSDGSDLVTITLHNGDQNISAEALRRGSSVYLGNGQNACIPQYTEGSITIPGKVTIGGSEYSVEVNQLAFRLCNKLTEVTVGEGVTKIGDMAFVGCSSLQKVSLPSTLNRIGGGAFVNLPKLTEVKCAAVTAPAWLYNDLFDYDGTATATAKLASRRTLYVPRGSALSYRNTKYGDVGWADAFGLISVASAPTKTLDIASFSDLENLATRVNGGDNMGDYTIRLTADLINTGDNRNYWYALTPIGTAVHPFCGVFDGQGHTIKNVYNDGAANVGLFGYTDGAIISNLILQNFSLKGNNNVGVVVGNANFSLIHDVLVYDAVATNGTQYLCAEATNGIAGGLAGRAGNTTIIDSYFYGQVQGTTAAGGIVGSGAAINVNDCAAGYSVEATTIAGGIIGQAGTTTNVANCYSRCTIAGTTKGGIIGQTVADNETGIINCAYLDASQELPAASGNTEGVTMRGNRLCTTVSDMEGLTLQDLLGNDKWYYFQGDVSDCPVPASLADAYLVWAGMKDANGYVYAPNDAEASSYCIVGYKGSKTELELPETFKGKPVTKVGDRAFAGSAITYMTIPNSITSIGTEAFANCSNLYYFNMGKGVASTYNGWLKNCPKVANIYIADDNPAYCCFKEKVIYDKDKTRIIRCSPLFEGIFTLPSTVTAIEPGAFTNCDRLAVVDMSETKPNWGELHRNLSNNLIYGAGPYTLFILNEASSRVNYLQGEPNIVVLDSQNKYFCDMLNIDDGRGWVCPVVLSATTVNYNREFRAAFSYDVEDVEGRTADYVYKPKAYTLCLPFTPHVPYGKGAKLYRYMGVTTEDGVSIVTFEELGKNNDSGNYKTNQTFPYYLVMEGEETISVKGSEANVQTGPGSVSLGNYTFYSTFVTIPNETLYDANKPAYILQSDGNWHKVPQGQPKAYVAPFRAYLRANSGSEVRTLVTSIGAGDETAICNAVVRTIDSDGTQHYYDLHGRRLSARPQHGLYINNGKTHIAK